jgi:hypothetical protein
MKTGMKSWMVCSGAAVALAVWSGAAWGTVVGGSLVNLQAGNNAGDPGVWSNNGSLGGAFNPRISTGAPVRGNDVDLTAYYDHTGGASWGDSAGSTVNIHLESFTVESWIRPTAFPGGENQIYALRAGNTRTSAGFRAVDGGERKWIQFELNDTAGNRGFMRPTTGSALDISPPMSLSPTQNEWLHLAMTYQNATTSSAGDGVATVYSNGVQIVQASDLVQYFSPTGDDFNLNTVGIQAHNESPGRAFEGHYNTFRVYDSALSQAQILQNFTTGPSLIPEPGTLALLSVGGLVLYLRRRRLQ